MTAFTVAFERAMLMPIVIDYLRNRFSTAAMPVMLSDFELLYFRAARMDILPMSG